MKPADLTVLSLAGMVALSMSLTAQQQGPANRIPLAGLTAEQQTAFNDGSRAFSRDYQRDDGLGPVFNDESCNDCHRNGAGSNRTVTRFGMVTSRGAFDPLNELGGDLIQSRGIGAVTIGADTHLFEGESPPASASVRATRRSHAVLGLGFVDAVPDDTWRALAQSEFAVDRETAGRVNLVRNLSNGQVAVGKFGWKAQVPTLTQFSADALLNEMGITNPLFRNEVCPQGDCWALDFNPAPALNDDGHAVDAIRNFMTLLAAPTRGAITPEVVAGEQLFAFVGCDTCHRPTIRTGPSDIRALHQVDFHPYSDFLLHDMGSLGDGIEQGLATGRDMRTQPLWGLRTVTRFMHDARSTTIEDAIRRHDGQGRFARDLASALPAEQLAQLLAFLRSL